MKSINLVTWFKSAGQKIGNMGVMAKKFWKMMEQIVLETYDIYIYGYGPYVKKQSSSENYR